MILAQAKIDLFLESGQDDSCDAQQRRLLIRGKCQHRGEVAIPALAIVVALARPMFHAPVAATNVSAAAVCCVAVGLGGEVPSGQG